MAQISPVSVKPYLAYNWRGGFVFRFVVDLYDLRKPAAAFALKIFINHQAGGISVQKSFFSMMEGIYLENYMKYNKRP